MFNDTLYKQIFGIINCKSISPVLANLNMDYFESVSLPTMPVQLPLWLRYVDDAFSLWSSLQLIQDFVNRRKACLHLLNLLMSGRRTINDFFLILWYIVLSNNLDSQYLAKLLTQASIYIITRGTPNMLKKTYSSFFLLAYRLCDPQYILNENLHIKFTKKKLASLAKFIDCALSQNILQLFGPPRKLPVNLVNLCSRTTEHLRFYS